MPETKAGLSLLTSSIIAGVISLPTNMKIITKIIIAKIKLAIGPAATIKDLWYKGFKIKSFSLSSLVYLLIISCCSD